MNTHTLKATATALREKLEALEDQNSDAKLMLNTLRGLLLKAENGKIHAPWRLETYLVTATYRKPTYRTIVISVSYLQNFTWR